MPSNPALEAPDAHSASRAPGPAAPAPAQERIALLIILSVTLISYLNVLKFEFVYDDKIMQVSNPMLHDWKYLPQLFTHDMWSHRPELNAHYYRPGPMIWLLLIYSLAGLEPAFWHFSTLLVYLGMVGMVWLLARRTLSDGWTAIVATLLFALHPIHVESVAWIAGMNESGLAILWIGTYLCYRNFRERAERRTAWLAASLFLYAWTLLFKETSVVMPLFIFLDEFIRSARGEALRAQLKKAAAYAAIYVPLTLIYLLVRTLVLRSVLPPVHEPHTLLQMMYTSTRVLAFYLQHALWPVRMSVIYDIATIKAFSLRYVLLPVVLVVVAVGLCFRYLPRKAVASSLLWMLLPLMPALVLAGLLGPSGIVHDRYFCLSAVGPCFLLAMLISRIPGERLRLLGAPALQLALVLGLSALMIAGIRRESAPWENNRQLFSRGVEVSPYDENVTSWLSSELLQEGEPRAAIEVSRRYLERNDRSWYANFDLANAYFVLRDFPSAERHYLRATELYDGNAREYFYLGLTRMRLGDPAGAETALRRAILLSPKGPGYRYALGQALAAQGRLEECLAAYRAELENYPDNPGLQRQVEELEIKVRPARTGMKEMAPKTGNPVSPQAR